MEVRVVVVCSQDEAQATLTAVSKWRVLPHFLTSARARRTRDTHLQLDCSDSVIHLLDHAFVVTRDGHIVTHKSTTRAQKMGEVLRRR